jgi:hypothetical protein
VGPRAPRGRAGRAATGLEAGVLFSCVLWFRSPGVVHTRQVRLVSGGLTMHETRPRLGRCRAARVIVLWVARRPGRATPRGPGRGGQGRGRRVRDRCARPRLVPFWDGPPGRGRGNYWMSLPCRGRPRRGCSPFQHAPPAARLVGAGRFISGVRAGMQAERAGVGRRAGPGAPGQRSVTRAGQASRAGRPRAGPRAGAARWVSRGSACVAF